MSTLQQNTTEDLEHIIWNCQNEEIKKLRNKFLDALGKIASDIPCATKGKSNKRPKPVGTKLKNTWLDAKL